uniref:Uncharacterized protein n=1 Tax=Ditylum brightwellii TaxID=49249 RepID=A0A7S4SYY1_9STRA
MLRRNTDGNDEDNNNHKTNSTDGKVIATASDAILAKLSAVSRGYYHDPFISHFATNASGLTASGANTNIGGGETFPTSSPFHMSSLSSPQPTQWSADWNGPPPSFSSSLQSQQMTHSATTSHHISHHHSLQSHHKQLHRHHHQHLPHSYRHHHHHHPGTHASFGMRQQHPQQQHMQQHSPLIRRGTHARVCCIDRTISQFLSLPSSSLQETKKTSSNFRCR